MKQSNVEIYTCYNYSVPFFKITKHSVKFCLSNWIISELKKSENVSILSFEECHITDYF